VQQSILQSLWTAKIRLRRSDSKTSAPVNTQISS